MSDWFGIFFFFACVPSSLSLKVSHRITVWHTLQHVLGFCCLSNFNAGLVWVFFISRLNVVIPFLKLLYQLVLPMLNECQLVSLGGDCALEVYLPSVCTSACFDLHWRVVLVSVNLIPSGTKQEKMLQECSKHVLLTNGQPVCGIRCFRHGWLVRNAYSIQGRSTGPTSLFYRWASLWLHYLPVQMGPVNFAIWALSWSHW